MKKKNIVQKSSEFDSIIRKRNGIVNDSFIINTASHEETYVKFGITFTKNLCNAVMRNKLKRQVKSILDNNKNIYENSKIYIIIIRKGALNKKYQELEEDLLSLFKKLKEKQNEKEKHN